MFACAQILGVDALHTKDVRQTHKLLVEHLAHIRSIPVFARCKFVFVFESNLAFESQHLLHAVQEAKIHNWVSLSEGQQGSLGWLTTAERKARARCGASHLPSRLRCGACAQQQMCLLVREALSVGKIAIGDDFFSTELAKTEAKMRIRDELGSYCVVTEPAKTTFGKIRTTYTGKLYGKQDDLAIAIQLALIGCQKFFQEPRYRNFRADDYITPNGLGGYRG